MSDDTPTQPLGDVWCGERLGRENRMHSRTKMAAHHGGGIAEDPGELEDLQIMKWSLVSKTMQMTKY